MAHPYTRGLLAKFKALDVVANVSGTYGIYIPIADCYFVAPPPLAYKSKAPLVLDFTSRKTTKDIAGDDLPVGTPADGVYWYLLKF